METGASRNAQPEVIARIVHESVRAYRTALGQQELPGWEEAPQWMRESSVAAVRDRMASPDAPPSAQHEAWCREKLAKGWRYGESRDDAARIHPLLVPYDQLPEAERRKDALIQAIVDAFLRDV